MKNKFSFLVIFIAILGEILYPYAINNTNSILASITSVIYFFSLPLLAYYLGKQAKEDKDNYDLENYNTKEFKKYMVIEK